MRSGIEGIKVLKELGWERSNAKVARIDVLRQEGGIESYFGVDA
jgi:hypothetical protein